jgi:hypothetical protein
MDRGRCRKLTKRVVDAACFLPRAAFDPGSTMEARGSESGRAWAKTTVVAVGAEVN